MSANPEHGVSDQAIVFKFIIEELVSKIPAFKKKQIYKQHCKKVEKRNAEKSKIIKGKKGSKREYSEKPMNEKEYFRFHVLLKLLETKYAAFLDDCTLHEAGYIIGISRERIRQIEYQALLKIKNPNLLKRLNKRNSIEAVMEYKEIAVQRKNRKRMKEQ